MALSINSNISSLNNRNSLNKLESPLQTNLQRLSSGKRINSAKDDAAGLAIAARFASQIIGASQGQSNITHGTSMLQVAEGFTSEIESLTQRGRELAIQSSNGTMSDTDRAALQAEYSNIQSEVQRLTDTAEFNGQKLLNQDSSVGIQIDGNAGDNIDINTHDLGSQLSSFLSSDISTQAGSQASLATIDTANESINTIRAEYGAAQNQLQSAANTLAAKEINMEAAKSRILDTDFAQETSDLTKNLILRDSATAMQGYTQFSQNQVLSLLGAG